MCETTCILERYRNGRNLFLTCTAIRVRWYETVASPSCSSMNHKTCTFTNLFHVGTKLAGRFGNLNAVLGEGLSMIIEGHFRHVKF